MADNRVQYGFRWSMAHNGVMYPTPIVKVVASDAGFDINGGGSNCKLSPGDVVRQVTDGTVDMCDGTEGSGGTETPAYVVVAVGPHWDGEKMEFLHYLPSHVVWGTVEERKSTVLVVPVSAGTWEVDVDDNTEATTASGYRAFEGENVDHILTGTENGGKLYPKLDISTHAVSGSLVWRIVGLSPSQNNQDLTGENVKMLVQANVASLSGYSTTGV